MGRRLKVNRIFVLAYDQIGFGKRQSTDLSSYDDWIEDLVTAFEYQQGAIGDKPLYVMANSMGAAVALKAISRKRINPAGLALFSPGLEGNHETFKLTYRLRALFQALTAPESLLTLPYGPDLVTRDEFVRKWIANDPDMRLTMPAKMLLEILKMTRGIVSDARNVHCPTIMLNAGIDKLVDTSLNQRFFERLGAVKKSQHTYEHAFHDLMFDPVLDEVVSALLTWMKELNTAVGTS
jgi:alpha-beta hydrolase superfamily lysophospholipase